MSQSLHLYSLQKIDSQIDRIDARVVEIEKVLQSDRFVIEAQKKLDAVLAKLKQAQRELGLIEDEVKSNKIKQETNEASLYGGKIHNPKELQDLQKDIETRKKLLSNLEEKQLEAMISLEEIEKEQTLCRKNLDAAQATAIQQKASLAGERDALLKNKTNLEQEKQATLASISPENIQTYTNLRRQKRGIAVSAVEDKSCASCGADLRPEEMQMIKSSGRLHFCSSCGRILFAD